MKCSLFITICLLYCLKPLLAPSIRPTVVLDFDALKVFGDNSSFLPETYDFRSIEVYPISHIPPVEIEPISEFRQITEESDKADVNIIRTHFNKIGKERNHNDNSLKKQAQKYLISALQNILGNDSLLFSNFCAKKENILPIDDLSLPTEGFNIIGLLKGQFYGKQNDGAIFVGAHYDTVPKSPGIDDNASGTIAVLELARLLKNYRKHSRMPFTIYFILFDLEEYGLIGSNVFVNTFIADAIKRKQFNILTAIVFDMALTFNEENQTQYITAMHKGCPEEAKNIISRGQKGDFISVWARTSSESYVVSAVETAFNSLQKNKVQLSVCSNPFPKQWRPLDHRDPMNLFTRSDHFHFWYPRSIKHKGAKIKYTIPTLLSTNIGPHRIPINKCYHKWCDNEQFITKDNLLFLSRVIDTSFVTIKMLISSPPPIVTFENSCARNITHCLVLVTFSASVLFFYFIH